MTSDHWITIIEQFSLIIAAVFGIIAAATQTKDKEGKLTRWGKVAIGGILLTTGFSVINNYLKESAVQKEEAEAQQNALQEYAKNAKFQKTLLTDTERALDNQKNIQSRTESLVVNFNKSLILQNEISSSNRQIGSSVQQNLAKQETLLEEQATVNKNIERSLNPLFPFAVQYNIKIDVHAETFLTGRRNPPVPFRPLSYTRELYQSIREMVEKTKHYRIIDFMEYPYPGVDVSWNYDNSYQNPEIGTYTINSDFPVFYDFKTVKPGFRKELDLELKFCTQSPDRLGSNCQFTVRASSNGDVPMIGPFTPDDGIYIRYTPKTGAFNMIVYSNELEVLFDEGVFKSSIDLENSHVHASLSHAPVGAELVYLRLFFGPNYTREIRIVEIIEKNKTQEDMRPIMLNGKLGKL